MSTATVTRVSSDGFGKDGKSRRQSTDSDGNKSASELHGPTNGVSHKASVGKVDMPWEPIKEIDTKDVGTPDQWVPRHPELIRLTGRYAEFLRAQIWKLQYWFNACSTVLPFEIITSGVENTTINPNSQEVTYKGGNGFNFVVDIPLMWSHPQQP